MWQILIINCSTIRDKFYATNKDGQDQQPFSMRGTSIHAKTTSLIFRLLAELHFLGLLRGGVGKKLGEILLLAGKVRVCFFVKRDISAFSKLQRLFQDYRTAMVDADHWFYGTETAAVITVTQVVAVQSFRDVCIR